MTAPRATGQEPCLRSPDSWFTEDPLVARAITQECHGCPIEQDCLDWGLRYEGRWGIFGGTTPAQRAVIRRRRGIKLQHPPTGVTYPQRERRAS